MCNQRRELRSGRQPARVQAVQKKLDEITLARQLNRATGQSEYFLRSARVA
jgi:hypothetical protein